MTIPKSSMTVNRKFLSVRYWKVYKLYIAEKNNEVVLWEQRHPKKNGNPQTEKKNQEFFFLFHLFICCKLSPNSCFLFKWVKNTCNIRVLFFRKFKYFASQRKPKVKQETQAVIQQLYSSLLLLVPNSGKCYFNLF